MLRQGRLWPSGDLVPVADPAQAVVASLDAAPPGPAMVNGATGVVVSMQQVLDVIGELRGRPPCISTDPSSVRPVERPRP